MRHKADRQVYAMKVLSKSQMLKMGQVDHVIAERDVMAQANNPYIVKLHYSFQGRLAVLTESLTHLRRR